jgi:hypothetical protein
MKTLIAVAVILIIAGCTTKYVMKNCEKVDGNFSICEKP